MNATTNPPVQELAVFDCALEGTQLIEASAGTGKTWNICALYMRLLLERGLSVEQILVVTFTNAATAELRERIRGRIAETQRALQAWLAHDGAPPTEADPFVGQLLEALIEDHGLEPTALAQRCDLALQSFDQAAVFTIHGFCQRALGDAPFTAHMPLALELVPDDAALLSEVVADFWRRRVAGDALDPALAALLAAGGDTPERWARLLRRQLAKPLAPCLWPDGIDAALDLDGDALVRAHQAACAAWRERRPDIVAALHAGRSALNGTTFKAAGIEAGALEWDELSTCADPLTFGGTLEKARLYRSGVMATALNKGKTAPAHPFFELAEALMAGLEAAAHALALARLRLLRALIEDGGRALRARKREQRLISFDDLLSLLHERLTADDGDALAEALRARFPAALIDEFQDTDPLQFDIFHRIHGAGGAPLFLVGDPKQAIYSFRHADLHTYLHARALAATTHTLGENQRSTGALIAALNGLYARNNGSFMLPGLAYHPVGVGAKPRSAFVDGAGPGAALQLWSLPSSGTLLPKPLAMAAARDATAAEIARLLRGAAAGSVLHDGRPLGAGDIAVLVRSHAQGAAMRVALGVLGIGCVELSQASVWTTSEAEALLRVLAAVLAPTDERRLRAALATELLGLDARAIDALSADEAQLTGRIERFGAWRESWLRRGIGVMLRELMASERVAARLLPRTLGERQLTNLRHLAELLQQAESEHRTPHALLRWLQAQHEQARADEAAQMRLESDRNLVQIVTVHRAKGLEYPVVFCPFLFDGRIPVDSDGLDGRVCRDDNDQVSVDFRLPFLPKEVLDAVRVRQRLEAAAEAMRLVYVALTRAVHRCYLVTGAYTSATAGKPSSNESARGALSWLVAGQGLDAAGWLAKPADPAVIEAAWDAFAAAHPACVAMGPVPHDTRPERLRLARSDSAVEALPPPRHIPAGWRLGSYSALSRGAADESAPAEADDEQAAAAPVTRTGAPTGASAPASGQPRSRTDAGAVASTDILDFPRGREAGDCLHAVLERVDFGAPEGWPRAVDAALAEHAVAAPGPASPARAAVLAMLADLVGTELGGGLRLQTVTPARRLIEMEFTLPSRGLAAHDLNALLRQLGYAAPRLAFARLDGYLRGFIDLVFEHEGRYYVADWKSNHLGHAAADYAGDALAEAMHSHGYALQALLYAVALQRLLRQRIAGYDPERHFGGVYYLFVRGVRPSWRAADGSPAGVWFDRPNALALTRIDALLDGKDAA